MLKVRDMAENSRPRLFPFVDDMTWVNIDFGVPTMAQDKHIAYIRIKRVNFLSTVISLSCHGLAESLSPEPGNQHA